MFAIGPIGIAFFGFISIPIMAWIFSAEDIARLTIVQLTNTFAVLVLTLGLDQAYIREYENTKEKAKLLKSCLFPGLILLIFINFIMVYNANHFSKLFFEKSDYYLIILLVAYITFSFFTRFLSLILRMEEKGLAFSLSQIAPKVTFLILILFASFYKNVNFTHLFIIQLLSIATVFIFFTWNTREKWIIATREKFEIKNTKSLLSYGYPLALGGIAYWGLTSIDKIMLKTYSSLDQLGIYSISISFAGAALIIQSIFSTIWAPSVFKWINQENGIAKINIIRSHLTQIIFIIFLLFCSFAWLIDYILPNKYNDVKYIFMACLCFPLLYTLSETTVIGINISRKTYLSFLASMIALIFNIITCYFLIPKFGAFGAAVSTSLSFFVFLVARTELSIIVWKKFPRLKIYILSVLMITTSSLIIVFREYIDITFYTLSTLITGIYILVYFKKNLNQLKILLKNKA